MTNQERQMKLDDEKWYASQKSGKDLAGEMSWCTYCDYQTNNGMKKLCAYGDNPKNAIRVKFPCAKAFNRMNKENKNNNYDI